MSALAQVEGPVEGLESAVVLGPCMLGVAPPEPAAGPLLLGEGVVIRAYTVLYQGSVIGPGTHVGHGALIREGNTVGSGCSIGSGVDLEPGNRIGSRVRLHSGCFLASSSVGDDAFLGPHVVLTDDPHPPCPRYLDCVGGATIEAGASIGAGAVLLPGIVIGAQALVGAGSVVTQPVAPGDVVVGNPARRIGRRDELECTAGFFSKAYAWLSGES